MSGSRLCESCTDHVRQLQDMLKSTLVCDNLINPSARNIFIGRHGLIKEVTGDKLSVVEWNDNINTQFIACVVQKIQNGANLFWVVRKTDVMPLFKGKRKLLEQTSIKHVEQPQLSRCNAFIIRECQAYIEILQLFHGAKMRFFNVSNNTDLLQMVQKVDKGDILIIQISKELPSQYSEELTLDVCAMLTEKCPACVACVRQTGAGYRKVHVLGRERRLYKSGNRYIVKVRGAPIYLNIARLAERILSSKDKDKKRKK